MDQVYKLVLIGDGGVGKTAFVAQNITKEFTPQYVPTLGVEVHPLNFRTTRGKIRFDIWDTAGQEKFGGLRDGYYIAADCAIIMFDHSMPSLPDKSVSSWYTLLCRQGIIPTAIVGNKVGLKTGPGVRYSGDKVECVDIDVKSGYKCEEPFLALARMLTNDPELEFV